VPAADHRTVGELLADSDQLAREMLLDATPDHARAMVRSWNQLVRLAAELWAVLPSAPDSPSELDPMGRLRAVGEAIGRSVTAGHWPGQGPSDERLTEIADNLTRARHLVEPQGRHPQQANAEKQRDIQDLHGQVMHTFYVAAHGTAVALGAHLTDLQHGLAAGERRRQRLAERPTALEITAAQGMIARFDGFEQLAGAYLFGLPTTSANPDQVRQAAPATRLEAALAGWEVQAHRTLANNPGPADLVRGGPRPSAHYQHHQRPDRSRRQKGAVSTTTSCGGWRRRWRLTRWHGAGPRNAGANSPTPASRTDPALVGAASEVRAAIAAAATNPTGWATPDQLASRVDLPAAVKTLHFSMVASIDIAYVVRDTAADHPGLTAPARIIGMRAQGEAEIAIEQGETRYAGVTWTTRSQIAANQLIPLPEPARRELINLADDVIVTTNQAVAASAQLHPSHVEAATRSAHEAHRGRSVEGLQIGRSHPSPHRRLNRAGNDRRRAMPERLLTVQEAGEMLNTGERFPRRLIAERRICFVRVGRHVRIPESAIADYVAAQTVEAMRLPGVR
jgi:excisionase family DNA binding protein